MEKTKLCNLITYTKGKPPVADLNINEEVILLTPEYLRGASQSVKVAKTPNLVMVDEGELLLLWDGSNAGEFFLSKKGALASTMVKIDIIDENFTKGYLYYSLKAFEASLKGKTSGSGIPHVDKEILNAHEVIKFSKDEQQKIAGILSNIDNDIELTKRLITKHNRIKIGMMQDLLTKGIDEEGNIRSEKTHKFKIEKGIKIPNDWTAENLPFFCDFQNGKAFSSNDYNSEEGIRLVKPGNLAPTGFTDWNNKHVAFLPKHFWGKNKDYQVFENELLMNLTAQSLEDEFLGRVCITSSGTRCLLNQRIARIKPKNINQDYLFWAFKSKFFRNYVDTMPSGTKVQHLYNSDLENAVIAAPKSLEEQKKIAKTLFNLNKLINELHSKVHKLQRQKTGLMQDLLTGETRVTNLVLEDVGVR
ncbi:hypothetical protein COJ17_09555 [Bacillus thuringiensis]|uniref:restriction endonuclease subunit S n=1 Tax=Bacillus thuringiensis TaxID=1428 RepID=UPI000BF98D02|nr:restriction endonuclease subunit S [Bacillus thuringiensis]PFK13278.1 hypothetical protein COJ17_09555 [Bacillus thuringiensis]